MTSVRRVLLVSLIGIVSVVILVAAGFSYRAGLQEAGEMFDAKLAHSSRVLMSVVDEPLGELREHGPTEPIIVRVWHGGAHGVGDALAFPTGHAYETKLAFQVRAADGSLLLRSDSGPVRMLAPLRPAMQTWHRRPGLGTFTCVRRAGAGTVGRTLRHPPRDRRRNRIWHHGPLLLALPLLAVFVWLVVNWAAWADRVSQEIGARQPDHLGPIRLDRVPQEIQGLVGR